MTEGLSVSVRYQRGVFALNMQEQFPASGVTAISGPSGSGKTTLLRIICGLEKHAQGEVSLNGHVWQDKDRFVPSYRRRIGMVFQEPRLFPHLSVQGNLMYGAKRAGVRWEDVEVIAQSLGVTNLLGRHVRRLSGGEQRRVALARVLAMSPDLLLFDEPLTGLDLASRRALLPFLSDAVTRAKCPALYVSHDAEEIAAFADQVLRVRDGSTSEALAQIPDCIDLEIADAGDGWIAFDIGGTRVKLNETGFPGEIVRVRLPASENFLTRSDPGDTSGIAVLSGRIRGFARRDGRNIAKVDVGHDVVHVTLSDNQPEGHFAVGQQTFVVVRSILLLPRRAN